MSDIVHRVIRKNAKPRTGRILDALTSTGGSSSGSSASVDLSNLVKKTGETEQTVEGSLLATGELVAYSAGEYDIDLPIASSSALGAIKVGDGLSIDGSGVLTADGGGGGIENLVVTGSGNAVTTMAKSTDGKTITATKGETFATNANLTSHTSNTTVHVTATEKTNWNDANSKKHTHTNKANLDTINQNLATTSNVRFGNITNSGYIRATGDIVAYSTGSGDIDLPIASSSALGVVKTSTGISNIGGTIKGTIHSVLNMANSSTPSATYTSEIKIRSGYRIVSGNVASSSYLSFVLYDCTVTGTLSITANVCGMANYTTAALITSLVQDSSGYYRLVIYNPTPSAITLTDQRIYYTSIQL